MEAKQSFETEFGQLCKFYFFSALFIGNESLCPIHIQVEGIYILKGACQKFVNLHIIIELPLKTEGSVRCRAVIRSVGCLTIFISILTVAMALLSSVHL